MFKRIDFDNVKPYFDNGTTKWYADEFFTKFIEREQADNLPSLTNIGCFVVKGVDVEDYVLIDHEQNILAYYKYNGNGFEQMEAFIKILKVSKNFGKYEI